MQLEWVREGRTETEKETLRESEEVVVGRREGGEGSRM